MIANIDMKDITNKNDFHKAIQNTFMFDDYGYNLDSLHDELSSLTELIEINIYNINNILNENNDFSKYVSTFMKLLKNITNECDNIKVNYRQ